MILVNLLPPEFRKGGVTRALSLSPKQVKSAGILFLLLTLFFYTQYLFNLRTLKTLQGQWLPIRQKVERVNKIKKEVEEEIKKEGDFLANYVLPSFPTTQILSAVSELLPDTIWLIELKVSRKQGENTLFLKGLALPAKDHSSIQDIERYLRDLKPRFPQNTSVLLTTSRQQKEKMELTLFSAVFKWL